MSPDSRSALRFHVAAVAGLAALCALLYAGALDAPFVLDDWDNIAYNPYVRWDSPSLENAWQALTGPRVRRPVAQLSFGLDHSLGGEDARGYRARNVAIHALNGALVYAFALAVFSRLGRLSGQRPVWSFAGPRAPALAAALFFVAHPLQVQSVTYVVQRMTSLAAGFSLAALLLYDRALASPRAGRRRAWLVGAGLCGILALGSKETAVTLPLAAWLYAWYFAEDLDPGALRRRVPWLAACGGLALAGAIHFAGSPLYEGLGFDAVERLLTQTRVAVFYLSLVLLPLPSRLNLLHVFEPSRSLLDPPTTLACALALAGLLAVALALAKTRRLASFAILWLFLHLAVESSTLPLRMAFEHRLYLPLAGLALLFPALLGAALPGRRAALAAALAIALLSTGTWVRNRTWAEPGALARDVAAKSPGDFLARMQLAGAVAEEGDLERALAEAEAAVRLGPRSPRPLNLEGSLLAALGRPEEALEAWRRAAQLDSRDAHSRAQAADLLARLGRLEEALALYEAALARVPDPRTAAARDRAREALAARTRAPGGG